MRLPIVWLVGWLVGWLVVVAAAAPVLAKPRVAIAPIAGDAGNKLTAVLTEVLSEEVTVVKQAATTRALSKLAISGELDTGDARRLQGAVDADAVVHGTIKQGRTRVLQLSVSAKQRKTSRFSIELTSTRSEKWRGKVRSELVKRIAAKADEASEQDERPVRKKQRKKRADDDDSTHPAVQSRVRADLGATLGLRRLTYAGGGAQQPPRVGTFAPSGRIAGELYPMAGNAGAAARLGIAGHYDRTFGLAIDVPAVAADVPISQSHYALGVRYRMAIGEESALAFGLDYARRKYLADRSGLATPGQLDAPDVDYTAVVPRIGARTPLTPSVTGFADLGVPLVLSTGPIQRADSFGPANVFGVELAAGAEIVLATQVALRLVAEYSQISFSFKGTGDMATARGVTGATDRWLALAALLAVVY